MIQFSGKVCGKQQEMHDLVKAHDAMIGKSCIYSMVYEKDQKRRYRRF